MGDFCGFEEDNLLGEYGGGLVGAEISGCNGDEWIESVMEEMYEDATTKVRLNGRESNAFSVRVGEHQGSVLSPLLFIIVLEALSREFKEGLPLELLCADDPVLWQNRMSC